MRVAKWQPDLKSLKNELLPIKKLFCKDDIKVNELCEKITEELKIEKGGKLKVFIKKSKIDIIWVA